MKESGSASRGAIVGGAFLLTVGLLAVGGCATGQDSPPSTAAPATPPSTPALVASATPSPTPSVSAEPTASTTPGGSASPTATASATPAGSPTATPSGRSSSDDPTQWKNWKLNTAGWGPVKPGQPLPATTRAKFSPGWECIGPIFKADGEEIVMVFTKTNELTDPVNTISLQSAKTSTVAGLRIGDSVDKMKKLYPKLSTRQSYRDHSSGATNSVYELTDSTYSLFFEVSGDKVKHISVQPAKSFHPMGQVGPCGAP